jgi:hypothetical protein
METPKQDLDRLFELLEQETSCYRQLILDLKKESECLRSGSTDGLIQAVQEMDLTRERILSLHPRIRTTIGGVLDLPAGEPEDRPLSHLLSLVPPPWSRRINVHRDHLERLKERAKQINERNRSYLHESLGYLKEFVSLLTQSASEPAAYLQDGRRTAPGCSSWSLNREV